MLLNVFPGWPGPGASPEVPDPVTRLWLQGGIPLYSKNFVVSERGRLKSKLLLVIAGFHPDQGHLGGH